MSKLCNAFASNSSTNVKLSKIQRSRIVQEGGFLGRLLVPSVKVGLQLMKNVLKPLAFSHHYD